MNTKKKTQNEKVIRLIDIEVIYDVKRYLKVHQYMQTG